MLRTMLIDNEFHGIDLISTPPRLKQIADNNTRYPVNYFYCISFHS